MATEVILETERLALSRLTLDDAAFVLELLNDPDFIRYIGDRGVRTAEDARRYLLDGPLASYERFGFGLWRVGLKATAEAIGICGLVKRDALSDVDIGFAFLARHRSQGFAAESAAAVRDYAFSTAGLTRLVAITLPGNTGSVRVLEGIGLKFERRLRLDDAGEELLLYSRAR